MARYYCIFMEGKMIIGTHQRDAVRLPFVQHWTAGRPTQEAVAALWWAPEGLHMQAAMSDSSIKNKSTGPKQKTWEQGDVVEFFVKPLSDKPHYFEFHVTPHNVLLDLRIPSADSVQEGWESRYHYKSRARSRTRVASGFWTAFLSVPWESLDMQPEEGHRLQVAVCRYNYGSSGAIEYSSTAPLSTLSYHRPWEWHRATLN